jgi:hypothetical protein
MADKKISALTGATTPLAGTEVLPIVQSSATVKVSVADLTAGRAISATQLTLTTGNLIVASGQGIDFSATPGTGTSELLDDYEEGTFDVTATCGTSGTITMASGVNRLAYTKIGRTVTINGFVFVDSVSLPVGSLTINGLPFPSFDGVEGEGAAAVSLRLNGWDATTPANLQALISENGTTILIETFSLGVAGDAASFVKASTSFSFNATYITAT